MVVDAIIGTAEEDVACGMTEHDVGRGDGRSHGKIQVQRIKPPHGAVPPVVVDSMIRPDEVQVLEGTVVICGRERPELLLDGVEGTEDKVLVIVSAPQETINLYRPFGR